MSGQLVAGQGDKSGGLDRAGVVNIDARILRAPLCWMGHVTHMDSPECHVNSFAEF